MDLPMTQDFLEVVEERYHHQRAIAISAQLPVKEWPSVFKDPTIADAVLDRIERNAYRFDLKGPSRRPTVEHQPADAGGDSSNANSYTEENRCHLVNLVQESCPDVIRTIVRIIQEPLSECYRNVVRVLQESSYNTYERPVYKHFHRF